MHRSIRRQKEISLEYLTEEMTIEKAITALAKSCQSSAANVICNLRKRIEPDDRKLTYIKTVLGVDNKFASGK